MPSINSTEDLLNLLESNEEFRIAVRRWVLTDEILAVPKTLHAIQESQQETAALLKQVAARLDASEARQAQYEAWQAQYETLLASLKDTQIRMADLLEQVVAKQNQADERFDNIEAWQERTDEWQKRSDERQDRTEAWQKRADERFDNIHAWQKRADERFDNIHAWQKRADERFDDIDAWQKRTEEWQERTEAWQKRADERQERAEARLDRTEAWQDKTDARLDRMDTRMDNIETSLRDVKRHSDSMWGEWVERKAADKLVPYIGHIYRANRVYPFWGEHGAAKDYRRDAFEDAISDAEDDGSIHHEEAFRLRETDLVIRARRKSDGATLWFVVEASGTLDDDDIERVERSAVALRKVYPHEEVAPMLFGYRISSRYKQAADDGNIQVVLTDG